MTPHDIFVIAGSIFVAILLGIVALDSTGYFYNKKNAKK